MPILYDSAAVGRWNVASHRHGWGQGAAGKAKGLYKRAGEIRGWLDDPYEEPLHPDVVVNTEVDGVDVCVEKILLGMGALAGRLRGSREGWR